MKKMIFPVLIIFATFVLQGSGYVGEKPDIDSYFSQEKLDAAQKTNIDPVEEVSGGEIDAPPEAQVSKPNLNLAPTNIDSHNLLLVNQAKKIGYIPDMLDFKVKLSKYKDLIQATSDLQIFAARANIFNFEAKDFLNKYKNKPEATKPTYKAIKDVNDESLQVLAAWKDSRNNSKYVPYSAFNGAYQPSVIRSRLKILNTKLDKALGLINDINL